MKNEPHPEASHFGMSAGADHLTRRPMTDLAEVERTMDEIEARNSSPRGRSSVPDLTVASLNSDAIWKNYRQNRGTPVAVHRR
jgi:hypothetical protein